MYFLKIKQEDSIMKQKRLNFVYDEEIDLFIENDIRLYAQNDNINRNNSS